MNSMGKPSDTGTTRNGRDNVATYETRETGKVTDI